MTRSPPGAGEVLVKITAINATLPVKVVSLVAEERRMKGSYIGTCVPACDVPRHVAL